MGSDAIAIPALEMIRQEKPGGLEIEVIYTQPDRKHGRGLQLRENPVKQWAKNLNIDVRQPEKVSRFEREWLTAHHIELVLVMAYGHILSRRFLEAFPRGVYNLHASLLPKYRGASPIHTALVNGESETGISFMRLVPAMDAGPVCDRERVEITRTMMAPDLISAMSDACVPVMRRSLSSIIDGSAEFEEQDESAASYCRLIRKEDANFDWRQPAEALDCRFRGFQPWPGARFQAGGDWIRIGGVEIVEPVQKDNQPGLVLQVEAAGVVVQCGQGQLRLTALQRPGGRMLPAAEFLRGYPLEPGERLPLLETEPLVR